MSGRLPRRSSNSVQERFSMNIFPPMPGMLEIPYILWYGIRWGYYMACMGRRYRSRPDPPSSCQRALLAFIKEHLQHSSGCQNDGPFLGTLNIRCHIIIGLQKGLIILTTTHPINRMTSHASLQGYKCSKGLPSRTSLHLKVWRR